MRSKFIPKFPGGVSSMIISAFHDCFKKEDNTKKIDSEDRKLTPEEMEAQREGERLQNQREEELRRQADEREEEEKNGLVIVHPINITDDGESGYTGLTFRGDNNSPLLEEVS